MKRQAVRLVIAAALVTVTIFAAMLWSGKYESDPDPKARFRVDAVRLESDRGYVWLEAHLRKNGNEDHDLEKPVRLITADKTEYEPADTTFAGSPEKGFTDIWFKFWLEKEELEGPLDLKINGGTLKIKTSLTVPELSGDKDTIFKTSDWEKSWLGF